MTTFFVEFIELFAPLIAAGLNRQTIQFLDKEIFTDLGSGDRHEVDLLTRVKLRGSEAFILIHVENQSTMQSDFPERMFQYYARINGKFRLPVYPMAIFSYDRPTRPATSVHSAELFGLRVHRFEFHSIQLNTLNWREFLRAPNPVAAALMAKMRIAPEDRPHVKAQCARMIANLKIDRARSSLIWGFMNDYLKLTAAELVVYDGEMRNFGPDDKSLVLDIENEWTAKGRAEGQAHAASQILERRFGDLPCEVVDAIGRLSADRLEDLVGSLLDFASLADLRTWLSTK